MPNIVFNTISVEEKYADKLREIAHHDSYYEGICDYFIPMPKVFWETRSPKIKDTPKQKAESKELIKKYGSDNWYDWARENWGTKWGSYENHFDETYNQYTFQTAWEAPHGEIIRKLAEVIPDFYYWWEEEQGYGAHYHALNGVVLLDYTYDLPEWDEEDEYEITYLKEDYFNGDNYTKGYYYSYSLNEWLGHTLEEAKECLNAFNKN